MNIRGKIASISLAAMLSVASIGTTAYADKWIGNTDSGYKYQYTDGSYAGTGWLTVGSSKYYINSKGVRVTGWMTSKSGAKYYFRTKKSDNGGIGSMVTGWLTYNGSKYYFAENGMMVTGTMKIGNKEYTFNDDGELTKTVTYKYNKKITTVTETTTTVTTTFEGFDTADVNTYTDTKTEIRYE
jgi:hypothetical protein